MSFVLRGITRQGAVHGNRNPRQALEIRSELYPMLYGAKSDGLELR